MNRNDDALPVADLDAAAQWYAKAFGLTEVERRADPHPTVILERDGVRFGFAINRGDASQDGAAILVSDIERAKQELEANGVKVGESRVDERKRTKAPGLLRRRTRRPVRLLPPAPARGVTTSRHCSQAALVVMAAVR